MSRQSQGLSVAVRAYDELPEEQRAVYRARYVTDETREATCQRLGMAPERYDQVLDDIMRSLRKMVAAPALQASGQ
ncbi:hypothetical protein [Massilia varians]|jgi:DNA-directed RNA polymerase specialized sigma24 family protein|uniref:hypothetical protein n=1 Tax=Massilia varians TaxID=457921 RepID=UPI0025531F94|nr:hypothetical protein [Massilia varians]MDK6076240.1 hypothetical protein [Massilia varians]